MSDIYDTSGNRVGSYDAASGEVWDTDQQVGMVTVSGEVWTGRGDKCIGFVHEGSVSDVAKGTDFKPSPGQCIGLYDTDGCVYEAHATGWGQPDRGDKVGYAADGYAGLGAAAFLLLLDRPHHKGGLLSTIAKQAAPIALGMLADAAIQRAQEHVDRQASPKAPPPAAPSFTASERAEIEGHLGELGHYVPPSDIEGDYGLRWMIDNGIMDLPYLRQLTRVRRVQFMEWRSSPDMDAENGKLGAATWHGEDLPELPQRVLNAQRRLRGFVISDAQLEQERKETAELARGAQMLPERDMPAAQAFVALNKGDTALARELFERSAAADVQGVTVFEDLFAGLLNLNDGNLGAARAYLETAAYSGVEYPDVLMRECAQFITEMSITVIASPRLSVELEPSRNAALALLAVCRARQHDIVGAVGVLDDSEPQSEDVKAMRAELQEFYAH